MNEEYEEIKQLMEVRQMMTMPGWEHLQKLYALQREEFLRAFKDASLVGPQQKHGPEFYQGLLAGYDKMLLVAENLKIRYENLMEEQAREEKERYEANEAS